MDDSGKTRVLHIVGGMNRGGVEIWLMHVLRNMDEDRVAMDFLVHTQKPCTFDEEILDRGSKIIPCLHPGRPFQYARNFVRAIKTHGPYDVLHSHVHHFSGLTLLLARMAGVPARIAHSHMDSVAVDVASGRVRRVYLRITKGLIRVSATSLLAASRQAGEALFGSEWEQDHRSQVILYGIDLSAFRNGTKGRALRSALGWPGEAFVVGHVGAFREGKNHSLMLDIAAEIRKRRKDFRLLLVGDGPLRPAMERKAADLGLGDKVFFAGERSDVPELMKGAMDAFIMPSFYEGLGLVCVEAQAAGLPLVISDRIPPEVDVIPDLVERVSLSARPSLWAEKLLAGKGKKLPGGAGIKAIDKSPFAIMNSVRGLENVYAGKSPRFS